MEQPLQYLHRLLSELEEMMPPDPGKHHTITRAIGGSGRDQGDILMVSLSTRGTWVHLPLDQDRCACLSAETLSCALVHRAGSGNG